MAAQKWVALAGGLQSTARCTYLRLLETAVRIREMSKALQSDSAQKVINSFKSRNQARGKISFLVHEPTWFELAKFKKLLLSFLFWKS